MKVLEKYKLGLANNRKKLFQKNFVILKKRWPAIADGIAIAPTLESISCSFDSPEPTLVLDDVHLSSSYDRLAEAKLQSILVPEKSSEAWVYGVGSGDLPRTLLLRETINRLNVVVMNLSALRESITFFDHSDWLSDTRVKIMTADGEEDVNFPFAAIPSCLQLADDASARLRDIIFLELSTPYIHKQHCPNNPELIERVQENIGYVKSDGDVESLSSMSKTTTVVLAAAGPTLKEHYSWIKSHSEHTLIAVDAALRPLMLKGIVPDVVITMDRGRDVARSFFEGIDLSLLTQTPLVYFPLVHKDILNIWPGPRLTAYSEQSLYHNLSRKYPKGELFSSGSVFHPAVDLAVKMGGKRVVLLGADFSFPYNISHVVGSAAKRVVVTEMASHWVLDGNNQRVRTEPNYRGFLRDFERYIAERPEIEFINGSRKGALIQGTTFLQDQKQ